MTAETAREMTLGQLRDLVATMIGGIPGLSFEEAQSAIGAEGKLLEGIAAAFAPFRKNGMSEAIPAANSYAVTVPYKGGTTIKELVASGKYDWHSASITDKHFPQEREGAEEVMVELVHFDRDISFDDVLKELDKRSQRAANPAELLAFGAKYPEVQREFPIVALGQHRQRSVDGRGVVCLGRLVDERCAYLDWVDRGWRRGCWFAAVLK